MKSLRQPWASSTTASARKDPQPTIHRLRNELAAELPSTLGKLLRLAQLEQERRYREKMAAKTTTPAGELAEDLPGRIKAALGRERQAAMPAQAVFHAAFARARQQGLVAHDGGLSAAVGISDPIVEGALSTAFVLPPADFEKSGRPIPRAYWDGVRAYPFHCPIDLPTGDQTTFEWEDDPMPRFGSYDLMIARDPAFAVWANEARQRFSDLSIHLGMMRQDIAQEEGEETSAWADRAYETMVRRTGAEMPERDLSRLVDRDYDLILDDDRARVWWTWIERRWAIEGYLSQQRGFQAADGAADDDLIHAWLFLLVGRHTTDEWLQPPWLRARLFDWRTVTLFASPVPAVRYLVPRTALMSDEVASLVG